MNAYYYTITLYLYNIDIYIIWFSLWICLVYDSRQLIARNASLYYYYYYYYHQNAILLIRFTRVRTMYILYYTNKHGSGSIRCLKPITRALPYNGIVRNSVVYSSTYYYNIHCLP